MVLVRSLTLVGCALASAASMAITFTNVNVSPPPLSVNWSYSTNGNSISFYTPTAVVGDGTLRAGSVNIQYDALSDVNMTAVGVYCALGAPTVGSGNIMFTERVYAFDTNTNTQGALIGARSHTFFAGTSPIYSDNILLSSPSTAIRVYKDFTLDATVDTAGTDLAALAFVNQAIQTQAVPEPASLLALGLGTLVALRRKK